MDRAAAFSALQRFWCAQSEDAKAKLLAFVHLVGPTEVTSADLSIGEAGSMRLILRASGRAEEGEIEIALGRDSQ